MVNPEHVRVVQAGRQEIDRWRQEHPKMGLNLVFADLRVADLSYANLSEADLSEASLVDADLSWSNLSGADLSKTDLSRAILTEAKFAKAKCGHTIFANCNIAQCQGLELVEHWGPSSVDVDTLVASFRGAGNRLTPELETFFLGAGVPKELLTELTKIVDEIKYYSCFISYGEPDRDFAEKLVEDLRARGVPCWMFYLDAVPGKPVEREIEERLKEAGKMVVICSARSLLRQAVLKEIKKQLYINDPDDIIPISLDHRWTEDDFPVEYEKQNLKPFLTRQIYSDFSDRSIYNKSLERLLEGLKRAPPKKD